MFALSDGVASPRGLASYINTTRRSLFGPQAEVQRLDVGEPSCHSRECVCVNRVKDEASISSVLAQDGSRAIPEPVLDGRHPPTRPPPAKELCATAHVGSRAKPGSDHDRGWLAAWSVEQPLNEVIFSKNDSTYDVAR